MPVILPDERPGSIPHPLAKRLKLLIKGDKAKAPKYAAMIDARIDTSGLAGLDVTIGVNWDRVYDTLTVFFREAGEDVFGVRGRDARRLRAATPGIRREEQDLKHLNMYIRALKDGYLEQLLHHPQKTRHARATHCKIGRAHV